MENRTTNKNAIRSGIKYEEQRRKRKNNFESHRNVENALLPEEPTKETRGRYYRFIVRN